MVTKNVHVYNQTSPLQKVLLGNFVDPDYFAELSDHNLKNRLQKTLQEINEDLISIKKELESLGIEVLQPDPITGKFDPSNPVCPPITPRDTLHVIGDNIFCFSKENVKSFTQFFSKDIIVDISDELDWHYEICKKNIDYFKNNNLLSKKKYLELAGPDWPLFEEFLTNSGKTSKIINKEISEFYQSFIYEEGFRSIVGPNVIVLDDYIIIDQNEYCYFETVLSKYLNLDKKIISMNLMSGHTDGCLMFIDDQTVAGIEELIEKVPIKIKDQINIPYENYQHSLDEKALFLKKHNYYIDEIENNSDLNKFIQQYLTHWTGSAHETLFDVNFLLIDNKTALVSSKNKKVNKLFNDKGIKTIYVPWRHRFFVDAGLHCITLDLWRE